MSDEITGYPNYNPAFDDNLTGILKQFERYLNLKLNVCLPAVVKSYDRTVGRVTVQPAINLVSTKGGDTIQRPELSDIPVHNSGGGGFVVSFPLSAGDTGWLIFCDRDISIFKNSGKVSPPNTYRLHNMLDAFFIPDKMHNITVASDDINNAVLQTVDGNSKISVGASSIKLKSTNIEIDGDLSVTGSITSTDEITSGMIKLTTHLHGGVTPGVGTTGVPQ